ncbi:MAG TPA: hypothetical protein VLV83_17520, partial [Acidobacteriota bacterium]|nr:hypothetical protein [Acidobacteriota bacterium]
EPPPLGGDIGRATLFLTQAAPGQMLLAGTSSFRLDRLALYCGAQGYEEYCRQLGHSPSGGVEAFQDLMLDVILGSWEEPAPSNPEQRLPAVMDANRDRADAIFRDLMGQAGRVWGTLLAVRGFAAGESFVARNVGLRGHWQGSRRRLQLVFLDHDNLNLAPPDAEDYSLNKVFRNVYLDWKAILGGPLGGNNWLPESRLPLQRLIGIKGHLERIYGIHQEVAAQGEAGFDQALADAYRRTQQAVREDPALSDMFHPRFRRRLRQWDRTAREYLAVEGNPQALREWQERTRLRLRREGIKEDLVEEYVQRPAAGVAFVRRFAFLWEP